MTPEPPARSELRLRRRARKLLREAPSATPRAFLGFDGFIDSISHAVDKRQSPENYSKITNMPDFGNRIAKAPGGSTNIELIVRQVRMGGNGPLMALALGRLRTQIFYVGAVGEGKVHPIFAELAEYGEVVGVTGPGSTDAIEFDDGKVKLSKAQNVREVSWQRVSSALGGENAVRSHLINSDFVALTNWSMLPSSNQIYEKLMGLVETDVARPSFFFFDLGDPEKRARDDIVEVARLLASFAAGNKRIMLSLNLKEAGRLAEAVGAPFDPKENSPDGLCSLACAIATRTGISEVIIHTRWRAAASTADGSWCADGPFTATPSFSTGGGDHFNAGYCYARVRSLDPEAALVVGNACSGFYVREGKGPSLEELDAFLGR